MKRILIIGPGGAGKTTLAVQLGAQLGLPVVHLDSFYWRPGWKTPHRAEWDATVQQLLERDAWVMDGNYSATLERRIQLCDTVVFLDMPLLLCAWRLLWRALHYRNRVRPEMPAECPDRFSLSFVKWLLTYQRRSRPRVKRLLDKYGHDKHIVRLRLPFQVRRFMRRIGQEGKPLASV